MSNSQEIIKCPFCKTIIEDSQNENYNDCKHLFTDGELINWNQTIDYIEDIHTIMLHYRTDINNLNNKQVNDLFLGTDLNIWINKDNDEYSFLTLLGFDIIRNHYDYNSPGYSGIYSFYFHKNWDKKLKELSELLKRLTLFDLLRDGVFIKISNKRIEDGKEKWKIYQGMVSLKKKEHQLKLDKELQQIHNWYESGFLESIVETINQTTNPYKESYLKVFNKEDLKEKLIKIIKERFQKKWKPPSFPN